MPFDSGTKRMKISVQCPGCRKRLTAPASFAGKRALCPACRHVVDLPRSAPEPAPPPSAPLPPPKAQPPSDDEYAFQEPADPPASPAALMAAGLAPLASTASSFPPPSALRAKMRRDAPPEPAVPPAAETPIAGRWWYVLFALTLIPLAFSLLLHTDDTFERLQRTLEDSRAEEQPEDGAQKLFLSKKEFFSQLPEHKIVGAHLPWDTWRHWIYAFEAAAIFGTLLYLLFPRGNASMRQGLLIALATATGGILFLIILQAIAAAAAGCGIMYGGSIIVVIFWIVKFIGFSYQAALDPETGFLLSFLGFTFGVGLCEELTKALPALFHARGRGALDWQGLCFWGLASGIGFGVAEGIMYSSDFYNGVATADAYCVRFISCVALHAVWGGSTALMIWHWRDRIEADSEENIFLTLLGVLAVPMILHGLYDTCLKRELYVAALLTALASFVWLIALVEWSRLKIPAAATGDEM